MAAFVKALNAKIRSNPTLSYFCSTRTYNEWRFPKFSGPLSSWLGVLCLILFYVLLFVLCVFIGENWGGIHGILDNLERWHVTETAGAFFLSLSFSCDVVSSNMYLVVVSMGSQCRMCYAAAETSRQPHRHSTYAYGESDEGNFTNMDTI